jgi:hypothetical protein
MNYLHFFPFNVFKKRASDTHCVNQPQVPGVSLEVTAPSLNAQNFTMLQDYEKSAMFLG